MFNDPAIRDTALLGILWLAYFVIHSLLASLPAKRWISVNHPSAMPAYRISYNILAIILLIPPVWLLYFGESMLLWEFDGILAWITNSLALSAIIAFFVSTKYYDSSEFLGLRQLRAQESGIEDQENLHLSPFHHFVRHPWYFFALVIIWTRDMNSLMFCSACLLTLYFIVGSRLEDRKLIHYYGDAYRQYCAMVNGLFPLPWKIISHEQAEALINDSKTAQGR